MHLNVAYNPRVLNPLKQEREEVEVIVKYTAFSWFEFSQAFPAHTSDEDTLKRR
jgi:hypothetical protein